MPTLLVFGVHPGIPLVLKEIPRNLEKTKEMNDFRKEMAVISN